MEESRLERTILLIENNPEHVCQIETALQVDFQHHIVAIADGIQAINFLRRMHPHSDAPRPDLILLDLDVPGKDGKEILTEIKADPQLKRIPIVVFTLSTEEDDIFHTYALQGNCYVIKPTDISQLSTIVKRIEEFWLGIVTLPGE